GRVSDLTEPDALFPGLGLWPGLALPRPPVAGSVVPGGPADLAGLRAGDRIVAMDGMPVETFDEWAAMIRERPGETIELRVERGGDTAAAPDPSAGEYELRVDRQGAEELTLTARVGEVEQAGERVGQLG